MEIIIILISVNYPFKITTPVKWPASQRNAIDYSFRDRYRSQRGTPGKRVKQHSILSVVVAEIRSSDNVVRDRKICDKFSVKIKIMGEIQRIRFQVKKQNIAPCGQIVNIYSFEFITAQKAARIVIKINSFQTAANRDRFQFYAINETAVKSL